MKKENSIFSDAYNGIASFGEEYIRIFRRAAAVIFKRPVIFILKSLKRLFTFLFTYICLFFAPADTDKNGYMRDIRHGIRLCFRVFIKRPLSFFPAFSHCIKKGYKKYGTGFKGFAVWLLPGLAAVCLIICVNIFSGKTLALRIEGDGENMGFVASESDYTAARDSALSILGRDAKGSLPEIKYALSLIDINEFTDKKTLRNNLIKKSAPELVSSCGIFIDGEFFAAAGNESAARNVFEDILSEKKKDSENYLVSFVQNIDFEEGLYPVSAVISPSELKDRLLYGEDSEKYTSEKGDTPEKIAEKKNISADRLIKMNPTLKKNREIPEGTEIVLRGFAPLLKIKEVKSDVTTVPLDFKVQNIKSEALYSGSKRVLSKGRKGFAQVTNLVTYTDGKLTGTKEFSRLTLQEPLPERVQIGTRPLDEAYKPSMGGMFLWPVVGAYAVNSPFGYRWGKIHMGLDIGVGNAPGTSLGKTIIAVASGTVVMAGRYPSYGNFVKIDHGNGLQTAYGHCLDNSLLVVPGQQVIAGQPIARVGQTGYTTGPHLHFEVRVNGVKVDPAPYLGI